MLYLGGNDDMEFVFDLRGYAAGRGGSGGGATMRPASYEPQRMR